MSWWCWHRRSKWTDIALVKKTPTLWGIVTVGLDAQERRCEECGKCWRRRVKVKD